MGTVTLPVTSRANTDSNNFTDVVGNDNAIIAAVNGNLDANNLAANAVTTAKITDGNVTPAKLSSFPACEVTDAGSISIPNNTATELTFGTETFDTDTMHSTSANTGRLTATTAGLYLVTASVDWDLNTTGYRQVGIVRSVGNLTVAVSSAPAASFLLSTLQSVSCLVKLDAGGYVTVKVQQDSGGTRTTRTGSRFSASWVGQG